MKLSITDKARKISEKVVTVVNDKLDALGNWLRSRKLENRKQVLLVAKRAARARCNTLTSCLTKLLRLSKALVLDAVFLSGEYFTQIKAAVIDTLAAIMAIIVASIEKYERVFSALTGLATIAKAATSATR